MNKHLIQKLLSSVKCNQCGQHYESDNIDIIEHKDNTWFLSVYCPVCQKQSFVIAVVRISKEVEAATDLTEAELEKFKDSGHITVDYMLDLHNFMKDFSGDFSKLFNSTNINKEESNKY